MDLPWLLTPKVIFGNIVVPENNSDGKDILTCGYCKIPSYTANVTKMKKHISTCKAAPANIQEMFSSKNLTKIQVSIFSCVKPCYTSENSELTRAQDGRRDYKMCFLHIQPKRLLDRSTSADVRRIEVEQVTKFATDESIASHFSKPRRPM